VTQVNVVIGAGLIGQAIARRISAGKHVLPADLRRHGRLLVRGTRSEVKSVALSEGFRGIPSCLSGVEEAGGVYGTGVWKAGEFKRSKAMTEAFEIRIKL
jgi:hypothetical protein